MRRSMSAVLTALLLLTGCASTMTADVTRFHRLERPQGETLLVEPADPAMGGLEFQNYAQLVGQKLGDYGYKPAANGAPPQIIARLAYGIGPAPQGGYRRETGSSMSVGVGSWGSGVGVSTGIAFPIGKPKERPAPGLIWLQLRLYRAGDATPVFEGRAEAVSDDRDLPAAMPLLVKALFTDFPGQSGKTRTVKLTPPPSH